MALRATAGEPGAFLRVLGAGFGLAVIFGNTVGTGILSGPGVVARQFHSALPFLAVWVAVGLAALVAAPSLAELAAMMPRAGGYYVYARRAYGGFPAFLVAWTDWLTSCGAIAASAVAFGMHAGRVAPLLSAWGPVIPFAMVAALTLVQLGGIRSGSRTQNIMSALTGALFGVFLIACFLTPRGAGAATAVVPPAATPFASALGTAVLTVLFAYDGWDGALYFGEEVRNPGRDIPRAMFGGIVVLTLLYVFVNLALIHVLTLPTMAGHGDAVQAASMAVFGAPGKLVAELAMMVVFASVASACLLIGTRILAAVAADGDLPRVFARVSPEGTPGAALLLTAAASAFFILVGQSLEQLMDTVGLFVLVTAVLTLAAVILLRHREPEAPRPYRAWGYPATTLVALSLSGAVIAASIWGDTRHTAYALLTLIASYPVYRLQRRRLGDCTPEWQQSGRGSS